MNKNIILLYVVTFSAVFGLSHKVDARQPAGNSFGQPGVSVKHPRPQTPRPAQSSMSKPGTSTPTGKPSHHYTQSDYRPGSPKGGRITSPVYHNYWIKYHQPAVPKRKNAYTHIPCLQTVLGLTFGALIDPCISTL